jgi:hypothetical protein
VIGRINRLTTEVSENLLKSRWFPNRALLRQWYPLPLIFPRHWHHRMDWLYHLILSDRWPEGSRIVETVWSFRAVPSWWLLVPLVGILSFLTFWIYRREKLSALARWSLIGCRVALFGTMVLLICRPTLETRLQSSKPRSIIVLLDNSLSMALVDPRSQAADKLRVALAAQLVPPTQEINPSTSLSQVPENTPENLSRADLVRLLLSHPELKLIERLGRHGPVEVKLFGQGLSGAAQLKSIAGQVTLEGYAANESKSTLGDALQTLLSTEVEADLPAAIVVMSDGLDQGSLLAPEQAVQRARQRNVPVHSVGIGASDWAHVQIKSLLVPDAMFLEDTVTAQLTWRAQGLKTAPLSITLTLGETVVAKKEITGRNGEPLVENIPFVVPKTLSHDGPIDLRVVMSGPALEDAPIPQVDWNQRVRVIDRQVRVLVIDQAPRFETKFLMSAFLRDRRVETHVHFTGNDPAGMLKSPFEPSLPLTRADLFQFDLIILGDVNPDLWGGDKLNWLRDLVRDGAGLIILSGRRYTPAAYMKTTLAELIPVETADTMPTLDITKRTEAYAPVLTPLGQRHEMLALADEAEENRAIWKELPGFHGAFPALKIRPAAQSLLVHPTLKAGDKPLPIVALQRYGRGQVLYLGTDETWRWRANVNEKYFARFWGQAVYQLGLPRLLGGARRVQLSFDRTDHYVGQPSFLYARAYDTEYQPLTDAKLAAKLVPLDRTGKPSGDPVQPLTMEAIPGQPGDYRALLSNEKPGRFLLTLDAPEPSQLPFHVDYAPNDERIPAPMASERLKALSQAAGGVFAREEDLHKLPDQVKPQQGVYEYRRDVVLWNPLALLIVATILSVEWILRKWTNLS